MSKNVKIPRNTISLITPKGVHNYTVTLTTKRSYSNNHITQQGWKTEPKKEEKVEEKVEEKEKASATDSPFYGNMITTPFNNAKAKGHIRGHIRLENTHLKAN